jgi:pimeloyl-ACP methyl ester carboxylesterase
MDHVDDVLAVLAWLGRPTVLYGHSLGALVAAAVATKRPELVRAVVLEDPPSNAFLGRLSETPYYPTFVAMRRLAGPGKDVAAVARELGETFVPTLDGSRTVRLADVRDPCALRFLARCLADVDGDVFTPALEGRWTTGYDEHTIWRSMSCPVLLLRGDPALGGMLPAADADVMSSLVPDLVRIDVPGVGHLIHAMAADVTVRHMLNFLESV